MDNLEAKFMLNAYRPNGEDANDPRFAEALAQVRRDPMLERWFDASVAFDAAMMAKLRVTEVPADLRTNIFAGVKISRPLHWMKPIASRTIAAAFLLAALAGLLILRQATKPRLAGWQTQALGTLSVLVHGRSTFDAQSHRTSELLNWLQAHDAPATQRLPKNLETLEGLGCKKFLWNQEMVSVICFRRPDGGLIHLVITKASAASDRAGKSKQEFVQHGEWATATWREGGMICMLALEGTRDQLWAYLL